MPPSETTCAAELAAWGLDRHVGLAGRDPEALGDQLEVVDQGLHRLAHDVPDVLEAVAQAVGAERELAGQAIFLSATMTGAPSRPASRSTHLLDDPQRLPHLVQADQVPAVGVARCPR